MNWNSTARRWRASNRSSTTPWSATRPRSLRTSASGWEQPFDLQRLQNWQSPTTHILGGNPGVLMQVLGEKALPENYLGGKYAEKKGKIFADEAWRSDTPFLGGAIEAYKRLSRKLNPVLARARLRQLEAGDRPMPAAPARRRQGRARSRELGASGGEQRAGSKAPNEEASRSAASSLGCSRHSLAGYLGKGLSVS